MNAQRVKLQVARDRMSAAADITSGDAMGISELRTTLQAAGVLFVADPAPVELLAKSLADGNFRARGVVIARGRPAAPGRDGYFEPAFSVGIQSGHLDASGTIDFFDRELLKPVQADDYLGRLHPPSPGTPGKRVDGSEIKVDSVRGLNLQIGPGVRQAPDGRLYAAVAGVLVYEANRKIDVSRQHVHVGDVDLRSGNLDMEGALTVRGSVQHRFTVRATGDVAILANVESGSVYCSSKLRVQGGVRGGDSGEVCAEGDIEVGHAEGAFIRSGGVLRLGSAVNSDLAAHKIVAARMIRGGTAQAEVSVQTQEAGAPHASSQTLLAAAIPLERPIADVNVELHAHRELRSLQRRAGGAPAMDARSKNGKLARANAAIAQKQLEHKAELAGRREQLLPSARVHVLGRLHAGVTIQIGAYSVQIDEPQTNARFAWDPHRHTIVREGKDK